MLNINKLVSAPLAVCSAFLLAACGGGSDGGDSTVPLAQDDVRNIQFGLGANVLRIGAIAGWELVTHIEPYDLDKDGRMDLILFLTTQGYSEGKIVAYMNKNDGFVLDESYFPAQPFARWIESAELVDVNGDTFVDIVPHVDVSTSVPPLVWSNVDNKFVSLAQPSLQGNGGFIAIDADGDNDMDLLRNDHTTGVWSVLANDGLGVFSTTGIAFQPVTDAVFVYNPIVMDLDQDGRDDLIFGGPAWNGAWVNSKVPMVVMLNKATGWEQANNSTIFSGAVPEFTHLRMVRKADFNGDGHDDLVVANHGYDADPQYTGEYNGVLLSDGAGGFSVDLEGHSTVVAQQYIERNGVFVVESTTSGFGYRGFTHALAVGDLDQDGDQDIIFADICGKDVGFWTPARILYNNGDGTFNLRFLRLAHDFAMSTGHWTSATLSDLDGDSYPDLVLGGNGVTTYDGQGISPTLVFYNDGQGYFR